MKFRNNKCFKISSIKILANSNWIYEYVASDYNCFCLLLAIYKLGEICKYIEGYVNPPINDQTFFGENIINWMRVKDLKHNNKINKTQLTLSKKCFNLIKNKNQIFKKDSIVWSKSGTVGNVGLLDIDVCANRGVLNILPNEKVYKKYLYYILSKNKYKFQNLATGAVLKHFYGPNLMNFEVFLPNKSTQKQIIDIIEPIELIIELISVVKKNIIGFLDKIHKFLPKRKFKIKEIGDVFIGTTPYTKNKNNWSDKVKGESWINSERLTKSIISKKSKKYVSKMAYDKMIKANKGDLLFSIIDPSKDKISLAREKLTFNQSIALIKATKNLFFEIREAMRFFNKIKSGSAQQSINKSDIENTYVKLTNVKYEEFFKFLIEFNFLKDKILSMKSKILDLLISIY